MNDRPSPPLAKTRARSEVDQAIRALVDAAIACHDAIAEERLALAESRAVLAAADEFGKAFKR